MDLDIVPFDVNNASASEWQKYLRFWKTRHEETQPNVPLASDKSFEEMLR